MAYTDPTGHEALMEGSQIAGLILYCPESLEKTYLGRTLECLIFNNFSQEVTGAGIGIKVGLGVAGLDLPFDIVNIIADLCQYDDPKYKTRQEWWGNFALDALAFAPLIGLAKYAKYLTDAKAVFKPVMKKAGEIGEIIRSTSRKISGMDDVGEAGAKQLDGGGVKGGGQIEIKYPLSSSNKQHIKKHSYQGMQEQSKYLTDEQLIKNLEKNSFFNPEWTIDEINIYAEEAYNALRQQGKTGNLTYKVNGEILEVFIHPDGTFGTVTGNYKLTIGDFR